MHGSRIRNTYFVTALLVFGGSSYAQTLRSARVAQTIPLNAGSSIQAAIDAAHEGDVILVPAGVYGENIDFKGKAISVVGVGGPDHTILDGGGPVVVFHNGEGPDSLLQGFTIRNGTTSAFEGGGISAFSAGSGAATPTIRDCFIRDNSSTLGGGGVAGNPTLERCVILDNQTVGGLGGGIKGAPHLMSSVVARNLCSLGYLGGGGLYTDGPGTLVEDCLFIENRMVGGAGIGGGISGPATIKRSVFWKNTAGLSICPDGGGGGAMINFGFTKGSVENCTVFQNSTGGIGFGGIQGDFDVVNSIVRENTDRWGSIANLGYVGDVSYSNVGGGWRGTENFDSDPRFVDSAQGDHHLDADSPCIDTGDPGRLDPDGTRSDVGAFPFEHFYLEESSLDAFFEAPTWSSLSVHTGGGQAFRLLAGIDNAGDEYVVAGSLSGNSPGVVVDDILIPLNLDSYTWLALRNPNSGPFTGFQGTLDANGRARAKYTLAPGQALALAGLVLRHVFVVLDDEGAIEFVSNPVPGTLVF